MCIKLRIHGKLKLSNSCETLYPTSVTFDVAVIHPARLCIKIWSVVDHLYHTNTMVIEILKHALTLLTGKLYATTMLQQQWWTAFISQNSKEKLVTSVCVYVYVCVCIELRTRAPHGSAIGRPSTRDLRHAISLHNFTFP